MAISRIRGEQIRNGVLVNQHIGENAAIAESKLAVNWAGHYQSALETKKVVDFVQVGNKVVGGATQYNLSINGVLAGTAPKATSAGTTEGIITDVPYNKVIIRDAKTGDPLLDLQGEEVFGRLVHDGVDFLVKFYSPGVDSLNNPIEEVFTMPANQEIDFQYMERFNLKTVSELFAANEKFVAGSADITAHQNIEQLAKDLYGAGYTLDRDGAGNLSVSIQDQINTEKQARIDADKAIRDDLAASATVGKGANLVGIEDAGNRFLGGTVEAVLAEIKDALTAHINKLASNALNEGASTVGIHDAGAKFTATTVEAALSELADRAASLESGANTEVDNAKTRDADSANLYFLIKTFASLEARFVEIETIADREFKKSQDNINEVQAARGADANLKARLDRIELESSTDAERELHMKETGSVGIQNGGAVAQQSVASMSVNVSSAVAFNSDGKRFAPAAGSVAVSAANATNPRIDIVVVNASGAFEVIAGTAAVSPVAPGVPAGAVKLAEIAVAAGATSIVSGNITDSRVMIATDAEVQAARGEHANLKTRLDAVDTKNANQDGRLDAVEGEVGTARKSTALTGAEVVHANLDARLEATDTQVKANKDELVAARGTEVSLDVRLDRAHNENGALKAGKQIHSHFRARYQAAGGETQVLLSAFNKANLPKFQVGDDSLEVFINGQLQEPTLNYKEGVNGDTIIFDLGDGTVLIAGDIVQIKYYVNNAE